MRKKKVDLMELVDLTREELLLAHRDATYYAYLYTARSVYRYCGTHRPALSKVYTREFVLGYERYLFACGLKRSTVMYYTANLRALYGEALKRMLVEFTLDLFSGLCTGSNPTEKRAIDPGVVGVLATADLSEMVRLERSRDFFVLSFLLQGIPFVDLAHLLKSDLQGDRLVYRRRKTNALVTVVVIPQAQRILDKYMTDDGSPYALPILNPAADDLYTCYRSALRRYNRHLETLSIRLNLGVHLSSYVARHSWATIAHHGDVSMGVVSQAMGHCSESITRTYLSSFKEECLAEANWVVMNEVLSAVRKSDICSEERLQEMGLTLSDAEEAAFQANYGQHSEKMNREEMQFSTRSKGGFGRKKKCPSTRG